MQDQYSFVKDSYHVKNIVYSAFLFFITVIITYYFSADFKKLYYFTLAVIFWYSKNSVYWIAFIFMLFMEPGTLLGGDTTDASKLTPSFSFPFVNLTTLDLFTLVLMIKTFRYKEKQNFYYLFWFLLISFLFFTIYFTLKDDYDTNTYTGIARFLISYSLLFNIPKILNTTNKIYLFGSYIYFLLIIILFSQIYTIITGQFLISVFADSSVEYYFRASGLKGIEVFIILIIIYLEIIASKANSDNFLKVFLFIGFLTLIISSTRVWFFIIFVLFSGYYLFVQKKAKKFFSSLFITGTLFLVMYMTITPFQKALDLSLFRFGELNKVTQGDQDAEGGGRIYERLPRTLVLFNENMLLGGGFGDDFQHLLDPTSRSLYGDYHVGNFNLLANIGILGFVVYLLFWILVINKLFISMRVSKGSIIELEYKLLLLSFICLLLLHFTSYQIFGFTVHPRIIFAQSLIFSFINIKINKK